MKLKRPCLISVVYDCNPTLSTVAGREDRGVRTVARVLSLDGELERDQRCLVVKRKKACEEDGKAPGQACERTGRPLVGRKPQREEERG